MCHKVDVNVVREARKKRKSDADSEDTTGVDWELANRSALSLASKQGEGAALMVAVVHVSGVRSFELHEAPDSTQGLTKSSPC